MKIKEISIKNFRGIKDLSLKMSNFTTLIGKNGVGKSTILHALNFFKEPKYRLKNQDYYNSNLTNNIEVSITFLELNEQEKQEYKPYIQNNELRIIKIAQGNLSANNPSESQKYYGERLAHRNFSQIREIEKKTEKKMFYNSLRIEPKYSSLPEIGRKSADVIETYLTDWEKDHPEELEIIRDSGQFFGWKNVGIGRLDKYMEFFFIPAVHEYSEEEKAEGSTYLNEILDLTIRRTYEESDNLTPFKEKVKELHQIFIDKENKPITESLSQDLSNRLNQFAPNCDVSIKYLPGEVQFKDTNYFTELKEFGFQGPISFMGHGVQRAFFFTIIQFLSEQRIKSIRDESDEQQGSEEESNQNSVLILLIIEEPELYQHPNRIKLIKKLFEILTSIRENSKFHFQIICSSHSPYFIDIKNVENIRILRKFQQNNEYIVNIKEINLDNIASKLKISWDLPKETICDASTLLSRLIPIMTLEVSEGFFSDKVIFVEGLEDKAALLAIDQNLSEKKVDECGIAIIPVLGKSNLDRPALIFKELGFPVYIMFDTDSDDIGDDLKKSEKLNTVLRTIMGDSDIDNPFEDKIESTWASLNPNLTQSIKSSLEESYYNEKMNTVREKYQYQKISDCQKNYKVMEEFIKICIEDGKDFSQLKQIIQKIHVL